MPLRTNYSQIILDNILDLVFLNVSVVYKLYLCLQVAKYSAGKAFSNLKKVKNELRSAMKNPCLNALAQIIKKKIATYRN